MAEYEWDMPLRDRALNARLAKHMGWRPARRTRWSSPPADVAMHIGQGSVFCLLPTGETDGAWFSPSTSRNHFAIAMQTLCARHIGLMDSMRAICAAHGCAYGKDAFDILATADTRVLCMFLLACFETSIQPKKAHRLRDHVAELAQTRVLSTGGCTRCRLGAHGLHDAGCERGILESRGATNTRHDWTELALTCLCEPLFCASCGRPLHQQHACACQTRSMEKE